MHPIQKTLINNRLGGIGSDYGTSEQHIPGGSSVKPFEVCMTLGHSWSYVRDDTNFKSVKQVVRNLCDTSSKGGNYLLNVGPTAEGIIPIKAGEILREVGKWLTVNGESIYGSSRGPQNVRWNTDIDMVTEKPGTYYLHIFNYPSDSKVYLNDFKKMVKAVYMLADKSKTKLKFDTHPRGVMIHVPKEPFDKINNVIVLKYKK